MKVGYAISDCSELQQDLELVLKELLPFEVIELQPEHHSWDMEAGRPYLNGSLVSVHASSSGLDLSSDNKGIREESIRKTIMSMDLANLVGAQDVILHSINDMGLSPEKRFERRDIFLRTFRDSLSRHYKENGHKYKLCIENIEYPKYPATLEETRELWNECNNICPVGMVIDVPHIWNTRRILLENDSFVPGWSGDHLNRFSDLSDYVKRFIEENKENILLFHVANFGENPIRTHDFIGNGEINPELEKILPELNKPIVLEIYYEPFSKMKISREVVKNY